ncbi:M15 family metallopeptidase [Occultella gossypii]|uniref:M15 family metallopeptidase n=1 Tax=Occultella gossypii TaxID=2800820 RepID=A0ABS7S6G2_9MICO|nr:M15 family metallopeptidase [Occultella gossypii]MBZ2195877.1 M15 family metallopeptidase [Occultella gossypii]
MAARTGRGTTAGRTASRAGRRTHRRVLAVLGGLVVLAMVLAGAYTLLAKGSTPAPNGQADGAAQEQWPADGEPAQQEDAQSQSQGEPAASAADSDNGRLDPATLVPIDSGQGTYLLVAEAAAAFEQVRAAALAAGVVFEINSAYRTYDEQVALAEQLGTLDEGGTAAEPGLSEHGWGISVDLTLDFEELGWMRANAGDFGFTETVAAEPWHWTYTG